MCDMPGGKEWTWAEGQPLYEVRTTTVKVKQPRIVMKRHPIRLYAGDADCWWPDQPNPYLKAQEPCECCGELRYVMDKDIWL